MRLTGILSALFVGFLCAGCVGYRLGPTNGVEAGAFSIEIAPFRNETIEPRLTDAVTAALRKQIQRDGTYRLNTRGDSDIVVSGTITRYRRNEVSFRPEDILTVRDYNITLWARVIARERETNKVLLDEEISGWTILRVEDDLPSAERQALPVVAEDLARNIAHLLVDGKW